MRIEECCFVKKFGQVLEKPLINIYSGRSYDGECYAVPKERRGLKQSKCRLDENPILNYAVLKERRGLQHIIATILKGAN